METKIHKNLAHRYSRAAAYLIDQFIVSLPIVVVALIAFALTFNSLAKGDEGTIAILMIVLGIVALVSSLGAFIYFFYLISKYGQTLGMKYIGIKAVKEDGSLLTMSESAIRSFAFSGMQFLAAMLGAIPLIGSILNLLGQFLTWGWCLFDKDKQNYYDKIQNVYYEAADEKTSRAKWVLGILVAFNLVTILIIFGAAFYFVFNSKEKTNSFPPFSTKPTNSSTTTTTKSYVEQSNEYQRNCMEVNNTKDFTDLKGYCLCNWATESDNSIPASKKEEIKNQSCGIYRIKKAETTMTSEESKNLPVNKNLYNSNYTNCLKDPNAYVEMKFTGKKATDGMKFCDCRATVVASYYTESLTTQNEMLIKKCSMYTN